MRSRANLTRSVDMCYMHSQELTAGPLIKNQALEISGGFFGAFEPLVALGR